MAAYLPQGWPDEVRPPGSEDFEESAVAWLLDVLPPDYRRHPVLRRYPAALASVARYYSRASVAGAREGYRTARAELGVALPPHAVDGVLAAYRVEGFKLAATVRGVELVERAIRGEVFAPRL
jgi:hypothetical protein